jgi:tetratricopeptide (TPR) repeat protein
LATSREGIGVADEQLRRVPSLDVGAAMKLFGERAQRIDSGALTDETAVEDVCRRLDGIPLAIELAASRMASMTATEVRDRLDDRFKLLVGSRRAVGRHQTLRQAVAWSYDLLDEAEKSLLTRCSVFAGGFDLAAACAVADLDDDFATLDLLDALVRKSLLVADRTTERTRFSMLETIRQFGEEQLVARGEAGTVWSAHARHFAGREADIMSLWDSPRQREAYDWFTVELANLRSAFRWAADRGDLDDAATIATYAGFLGFCIDNYEPIAWAEELIEPARIADHPWLPALYAIASQCWMTGRIDEGVRYTDDAQIVLARRGDTLPYPFDGMVGGAYMASGHPEPWIEWCRAQLQRGGDTTALIQACLVFGLVNAGSGEEAMDASKGLVEAAEAAANPMLLSFALYADGFAFREVDPARALDAVRRGLVIAQDSDNRLSETQLALTVGRLAAEHNDIASAFDHLTLAIRNTHNSGDTTNLKNPLAAIAALFDRLGRHESAATIAGYAVSPLTALAIPELNTAIARLRDVLGDHIYESLAHKGETMTTADMVTYAYDQIDQARTELDGVSK